MNIPLTAAIFLDDPHVSFLTARSSDIGLCLYGRGYAFLGDQDYAEGQDLLERLLRDCGHEQNEALARLKTLIPTLNGSWALIAASSDGQVLLASDRSRSVPLFYAQLPSRLIISYSARRILAELGEVQIAESAAMELLLSGYVSNEETIYRDIHQLQPAEILEWSARTDWSLARCNYFPFYEGHPCETSEPQLKEELEDILESVFTRFAKVLKGRRIILPLSGGFDSRLIAWMLYKNGIRDVTCYTYGTEGNAQVPIARRVAENLGFRWRFIEYNATRWAHCMGSRKMTEYWDYAFRGSALPHLQDFPAYLSMESDFDSADPAVILPGHVGDAWASEFALRRFDQCAFHPLCELHTNYTLIEGNPVVSSVIYRHLNLWPVPQRRWTAEPWSRLADKIRCAVTTYARQGDQGIWSYIEWVIRNRTALWILRTLRCVEYFGGNYRLCLGDYHLIDFLRRLPLAHLHLRKLYAATMRQRVFGKATCPLRDVPVLSGATGRVSLKRRTLESMKRFGLYGHYESLRRVLYPRKIAAADTWFSRGKAPNEISAGEALKKYRVVESLPSVFREIIAPCLQAPVYAIQSNGLLASIILAREFARAEREA